MTRKQRQAAYRWARKGARENPGIRFVALLEGPWPRSISYEMGKDGKVRRVM